VPHLDSKATLREASDLRLKAIDEGNTKVGPGRGISRANQNAKRDERVVTYDFKIFVVGGRKQYDNNEEEKQPDEYEPDKELSERTFIKVDEITKDWEEYFQNLIRSNGRWNEYCSTHKVELDTSHPIELLIFSPPDFSKLKSKGRKAEGLGTTMLKYFIRAGWPGGECCSLHRLLTWNDIKEKSEVFWRVYVRSRRGTYILRDGSSVPSLTLSRAIPSRSLSQEVAVIPSTETGPQTKHIKVEVTDKDRRFPPRNPMRTVPEDAPFIDLTTSSQESQDNTAIKKEAVDSKDDRPREQKTRLTSAQNAMISMAQWKVVHDLTEQFMAQETPSTQPKDTAWNLIGDGHGIDEEEEEVEEEEEKGEEKEKEKEKKTTGVHKRNMSAVSSTSPDRPKGKRVPRARGARETFMNQLERDAEERKGQRANQKKSSGNRGRRGGSGKGGRDGKGGSRGV
jgi:hypothetical protein